MTHATIVASARDSVLAINRVVSLLRGRCFAVVSFTAAKSHQPGIARLTIVVDAALTRPARVAACLAKLDDVWNVSQLDPAHSLAREMALVRVLCPADVQHTLLGTTLRGGVQVVHRDSSSVLLEIVAEPEKLDAILKDLDVPIVEFIRSGTFATFLDVARVPDDDGSTNASTF